MILPYDSSLSEFVTSTLNMLPTIVRRSAILGGGALRSHFDGTPVKDFDLFFRNHEHWLFACAAMRADPLASPCEDSDGTAYPSFRYAGIAAPYNLVGFRHMEPTALMNSFDFLCCCMVAYINDEGDVVFLSAPGAAASAVARELRINAPQPIKRLLKRSARYIEKYGYKITDDYIASILDCINCVGTGGSEDGVYPSMEAATNTF